MPTSVLIKNSLLLWPMRARRGLTSARARRLPPQLLTQAQQREVLALGLQHDIERAYSVDLGEELPERDRVDKIGVGAQLREHPLGHGPAADLAPTLLEGGLGRRVVDL